MTFCRDKRLYKRGCLIENKAKTLPRNAEKNKRGKASAERERHSVGGSDSPRRRHTASCRSEESARDAPSASVAKIRWHVPRALTRAPDRGPPARAPTAACVARRWRRTLRIEKALSRCGRSLGGGRGSVSDGRRTRTSRRRTVAPAIAEGARSSSPVGQPAASVRVRSRRTRARARTWRWMLATWRSLWCLRPNGRLQISQ